MKALLLLQARTNSSRLPGKVLLPVVGLPLVVLAARRAANTGHRVVVVTSQESSDDALCNVLESCVVPFFRGDLENTLKRFVDALHGIPDDQIVVRLTGDNVLPDGNFIDQMIGQFENERLVYLGCSGKASGLPYGVSAEITRAGYLREAHRSTELHSDREHVTPWIIRKYGYNAFGYYRSTNMSQYRCTVDTLDDYIRLSRLFNNVDDAESTPLFTLLRRLKEVSTDVITDNSASRMVLGTAQFGLVYGIANQAGQPDQVLVNDMVSTAVANGVQFVDTARSYGDSEYAVGKALSGGLASRVELVTKLTTLDDCPDDASQAIVTAFVERSVYQSCHALAASKIDVLMLHRAKHLTAWNGAVWDVLRRFKARGVVARLGVSVQNPEEALQALDFEDVEFLQIPYNILDYRWEMVIQKISAIRHQRPLVIHARSALLQGLLCSNQNELWRRANCSYGSEIMGWLNAQADRYTGGNVVELCLRFVISQPWVNGVVVGVETKQQLITNLMILTKQPWDTQEIERIIKGRPQVAEMTLNPATWIDTDD